MGRHNGPAWIILLVFAVVLRHIGVRALHFNYPALFMLIVTVGTMLILLAFSLLRVRNGTVGKGEAETANQASETQDKRRSVNG